MSFDGDAGVGVAVSCVSAAAVIATGTTIGCNGWKAEPSDGRNLKPTVGLNIVDDDNT